MMERLFWAEFLRSVYRSSAFGPWKRFYVLGSQIGGAPGASEWTNVTSGRAAIDVMLRVRNRRLIGYATRCVVGRCHGKSKKENGNELQTSLSRRPQRCGVERSIWRSPSSSTCWQCQ
jgi:hypothetical protein